MNETNKYDVGTVISISLVAFLSVLVISVALIINRKQETIENIEKARLKAVEQTRLEVEKEKIKQDVKLERTKEHLKVFPWIKR